MENTFIKFRTFNDPALARELTDLLDDHSVPYQFEEDAAQFDLTFSNSQLTKEYVVKLRPKDFDEVQLISKRLAEEQISDLPEDHYLADFTNEELIDIVKKPDEWNAMDYILAKKILKEKGIEIDTELLKKERIDLLSKPQQSQKTWIIISYVCVFLMPLISLFVGYFFFYQKKTLPNGEKVFSYLPEDRKHGIILFVLGIIGVSTAFLYRLYLNFNH